MRFVFVMAARETRAAWKRLLFFFVCIAVGVGAIVSLRSVIQSVRHVLGSEARTLIAADVLISTDRPWGPGTEEAIGRRLAAPAVLARTDAIETPTMVRAAAEIKPVTKMVELRAVQPGFPFYGALTLQDGRPYSHRLLEGRGALVRPEVLTELDITVGDAIVIGRQTFTVRGVIASEPGRRIGAFSLGPRVLVDYADLPDTGLLAFGSRVVRQTLLRVEEPGIEALVRQLTGDLRGQFVRVRSYRATEDQVGEDFDRAENYLSLVGLVIVVLGGIAVSSVTRVFVRQKIRSIAVMKCVGGTTRQILAVYLLQTTVLGLAGSLLGVGLAAAAVAAIPESLSRLGEFSVTYRLTAPAVVQGIGIGVLVSLLFAMVPLLEVRRVKPSLLLRDEAGANRRGGWVEIAAVGLVGTALVVLAAWQAASVRVGLSVCLGFAGLTLVLHLVGWTLTRLTARFARTHWFPLRQAVLHLSRPGNQTRVILLAVGLGCFFMMGVRGLQVNLLRQFALEIGDETPDMFLLDIQPDQAAAVRTFLEQRIPGTPSHLIPVLRARVTGVKGSQVQIETVDDVRGRGSLAREYVVTYRDHLEPNERIVSGRFWGAEAPRGAAGAEAEVSIEENIHERFGVSVGDVMRFDVLGRVIEARVTSVRTVEWRDARNGGFMFVFRPGVFEQAPQTFIGPVRGVPDPAGRALLQHDLVARFPNVSVIDLREILQNVRAVFDMVIVAIAGVGTLVLLNGALILVGAVAMTKFQRVYEAAIFKTLGASARLVGAMLVVEYGVLGMLAGAVGSFGAIVLNWGICRYALEIPWRPAPMENLVGMLATASLVVVIGVVSSLDVLRRKPLGTLRAE
jgi:putative ABC transport system permease protein